MPTSLAHLVLTAKELHDFVRPAWRKNVRDDVMRRAEHTSHGTSCCSMCGEPLGSQVDINHKVPWADIRAAALNDSYLVALSRRERKAALSELYNDPHNLEPTHPQCNQRHARRIAQQRHHDKLHQERTR